VLKLLFFGAVSAITLLAFIPTYAPLPEIVSFSDILNHFAAFFTLYLLHAAAYPRVSAKARCAFLFGYGLFLETVQYFLPARQASAEDIAVDAAGILTALFLHRLYRRFKPEAV
jgi:VanZ family protein